MVQAVVSFAEAVRENQVAVAAMSEPQLREVLAALREVRDGMVDAIESMLRDDARGYSAHRHATTMLQVDRTIKDVERRLPDALTSDLRRGARRAGERGLRVLARMIDEGERQFAGVTTGLRLPIARILASAEETLMHRHEHAGSKYAGDVGRRLRRQMIVGVIQSEPTDKIARRLLGPRAEAVFAKGPAVVAEKLADKQFSSAVSDAERLVRTELTNAYSLVQVDGIREAEAEDPGWLKGWDSTMDLRTCRDCARLNGETAELDRPFSAGVMRPPLHPNDRCGIVPWHSAWPGKLTDHLAA